MTPIKIEIHSDAIFEGFYLLLPTITEIVITTHTEHGETPSWTPRPPPGY